MAMIHHNLHICKYSMFLT